MGKNFTAVFAVCLSIAALPLACGGDDDDDGGDGGDGGKGGSSGSNTGGSATGGKGGTNTGGSATGGKGGTNTGGSATGGTTTGGTAGMGGADGGMGGDEGGMGGEGGMVEPPMTLCEQVCSGPAGTCQATCVTAWCADLYSTPACEPLIDALLTCLAADDTEANWVCTQGSPQYAGSGCDDQLYAAADAGCVS